MTRKKACPIEKANKGEKEKLNKVRDQETGLLIEKFGIYHNILIK